METVEDILEKIGATQSRRFLVFNKIDKGFHADIIPSPKNYSGYDRVFFVSSITGQGTDELKEAINEFFTQNVVDFDIVIPYSDMKILNLLHENCENLNEEYIDSGVSVKGSLPDKMSYIIKEYVKNNE